MQGLIYLFDLVKRRDFNSKIYVLLNFVFCSYNQGSRRSNKGYVPLSLIDFYFTKQNLHRKAKFRLENTDFINLVRFQDLMF